MENWQELIPKILKLVLVVAIVAGIRKSLRGKAQAVDMAPHARVVKFNRAAQVIAVLGMLLGVGMVILSQHTEEIKTVLAWLFGIFAVLNLAFFLVTLATRLEYDEMSLRSWSLWRAPASVLWQYIDEVKVNVFGDVVFTPKEGRKIYLSLMMRGSQDLIAFLPKVLPANMCEPANIALQRYKKKYGAS